MCGILAYKGKTQAAPILLQGLKELAYRGYDSAGMALLQNGKILVKKGVGKVEEVNAAEKFLTLKGTVGIAHTRWATTGGVTKENAHPHAEGRLALVHNGVVENYVPLRLELQAKGAVFKSETDTEVILKMILEERKQQPLLSAIANVAGRLHGRNAFVILDASTNTIIGVRNGAPLLLGIGDNELLLSSDPSPLKHHTHKAVFLNDGDIVVLAETYSVLSFSLEPIKRNIERIVWREEDVSKKMYRHYMLKEIMEQRTTLSRTHDLNKNSLRACVAMLQHATDIYVVGCGTAAKVAQTATYIFSALTKKSVHYYVGSEFSTNVKHIPEGALMVAISQSGETIDTIEAVETMQKAGGKIISVVNVMNSTLARMSDEVIYVHVGEERSVCSTKATTAQLVIMYMLALADDATLVEAIQHTSAWITDENLARIQQLAEKLSSASVLYVLGRGLNYPMALEAAIKLQEVSYIPAQGFAGGELKHGPLALIVEGTPCVFLVANDETKEDILVNANEIKARGGYIIGVAPENDPVYDSWIQVPNLGVYSPLVNIIPIQLLAYYVGVRRGNNIDQPRNLAKSVTVK